MNILHSNSVELISPKNVSIGALTSTNVVAIQVHFPHKDLLPSEAEVRADKNGQKIELANLDPRCHVHARKVTVVHEYEDAYKQLCRVAAEESDLKSVRRNVLFVGKGTSSVVVKVHDNETFPGCAEHYFYQKRNYDICSGSPSLRTMKERWIAAATENEVAEKNRRAVAGVGN